MMTAQEKTPIPARLGGMAGSGQEQSSTQEINNTSPPIKQGLSPRQALCLQILIENLDTGILSNDLRSKIKTNNVAQYVRTLRNRGLKIDCQQEAFIHDDGELGVIGRYRLEPASFYLARRFLEVGS